MLPASSPLRPLRPPRFFLLSGLESTAEDAEDAEEKRECERATHHATVRLAISALTYYISDSKLQHLYIGERDHQSCHSLEWTREK